MRLTKEQRYEIFGKMLVYLDSLYSLKDHDSFTTAKHCDKLIEEMKGMVAKLKLDLEQD